MIEDHWDHARAIHGTVRMIQEGLIREFGSARSGLDDGCPDLTFPQYNAMLAVRELDQVSVKHLAERLAVSPPSVSTMVDRLVEMGLVERQPNPSDRRGVVIRLSDDGKEKIESLETSILRFLVELMGDLTESDIRQWRGVYDKIKVILENRAPVEPSA